MIWVRMLGVIFGFDEGVNNVVGRSFSEDDVDLVEVSRSLRVAFLLLTLVSSWGVLSSLRR